MSEPTNEKCRCHHPKIWHEPNELYRTDGDLFCKSVNGICSRRSCSCSKYEPALAEIDKEAANGA